MKQKIDSMKMPSIRNHMKPLITATFAALALLALHGCARNLRTELGPTGLEQLRVETEQLWRKHVNPLSKSPRGVVLPRENWPTSVVAIAPEGVHVRKDGVYVFVASGYLNSQILFVPCPTCPSLDLQNTKANIREIAPHIYDLSAQ